MDIEKLSNKTLTLFQSFIKDLIITLPEYSEILTDNYNDIIEFETLEDKQALKVARRNKGRVNYFGILGINKGEILTFSKDPNITCEVQEKGRVIFQGEVMTLSGSALIILHEKDYDWQQVRGAGYWCYKGTILLDLYQQSLDIL